MAQQLTFDADTGWTARGHEQGGGASPRGIDGLAMRLVNICILLRRAADRIIMKSSSQVHVEGL